MPDREPSKAKNLVLGVRPVERKSRLVEVSIMLVLMVLTAAAHAAAGGDGPGLLPGFALPPPTSIEAEVFAPGLVSTALNERWGPVFSPDGREIVYAVSESPWVVLRLRRAAGGWRGPEVAPFSGLHDDNAPVYSTGGTQLYFRSRRPLATGGEPSDEFRSWVVEKTGGDWGAPRRFPAFDACAVTSFSNAGAVYCQSDTLEGAGGFDVYRAELGDEPVNLGEPVNSDADERDPFVAADGRVLLFASSRRPDGAGLYVSFRQAGGWSAPRFLGGGYDVNRFDSGPRLSPDGRFLFFNSWRFDEKRPFAAALTWDDAISRLNRPRNLRRDIYWLDAAVIEKVRSPAAAPEYLARAGGGEAVTGPYLGQEPPGPEPEIFAPGIVSTGLHEHSAANFTADGNQLFYSVAGAVPHTIVTTRRVDGRWLTPAVAPFSGHYPDDEPMLTADGNRLYFASRRPDGAGNTAVEKKWGAWYVERTDSGWSEPVHDRALSDIDAARPSFTRGGKVYFAAIREGGLGHLDIYVAEKHGDDYSEPHNLGPAVNSRHLEAWFLVDPDERYILFSSFGRPSGDGLYVSVRDDDGTWSTARYLGEEVNGLGQVRMPRLSPDGKILFFNVDSRGGPAPVERLTTGALLRRLNQPQNGDGDIYWVDAAIIGPPIAEP